MAGESKTKLSLVIQAVDNATAKLRAVNERMLALTAPARKLGNSFAALGKETGLGKLGSSFKNVGSAIGKVGKEALALGAKIAGLATVAGFAFFRIVRSAVDAGDKLGEMAQRVGLGVDAYAQLQFAAGQADVDAEKFNSSMDGFNQRLGQAKAGTGKFLSFLKKVSPNLANQVVGAKDNATALKLMARAFEKVQDPAKRAALAMAAGFDPQMAQFLGQGEKAIEAQMQRYKELAGSQEEFANNSGQLDNAMRETETAFLGLRNAAVTALAPALSQLATTLANVLAGNREKLVAWAREAGATIMAWVQSGGIQRLVEGLKSFAETVGKVVDMLGGLKGVAIAIGGIMSSSLVISIIGAVKAIGGFLAALLTLNPVVLAIIAAVTGVALAAWQIYENWGPIKEFFVDLWEGIKNAFSSAWEFIKDIGGKIFDITKKLFQFTPLGMAIKGGQMLAGVVKEKFFNDSGNASPQRAPPIPDITRQETHAQVSVDFTNVPKGVRVTPSKNNTAPLNLSTGVPMLGY